MSDTECCLPAHDIFLYVIITIRLVLEDIWWFIIHRLSMRL